MIEWGDIFKKSGFSDPFLLLIDRYVEKQMSLHEIAKEFGTTHQTIKNYLHRLGIPLRGRGGDNSTKQVEITYKEYQSMTYNELAKKHGITLYMVWSRTRGFPPKKA